MAPFSIRFGGSGVWSNWNWMLSVFIWTTFGVTTGTELVELAFLLESRYGGGFGRWYRRFILCDIELTNGHSWNTDRANRLQGRSDANIRAESPQIRLWVVKEKRILFWDEEMAKTARSPLCT